MTICTGASSTTASCLLVGDDRVNITKEITTETIKKLKGGKLLVQQYLQPLEHFQER